MILTWAKIWKFVSKPYWVFWKRPRVQQKMIIKQIVALKEQKEKIEYLKTRITNLNYDVEFHMERSTQYYKTNEHLCRVRDELKTQLDELRASLK